MRYSDTIILTDRFEIEDLVGNEITAEQWLNIKTKIAKNKAIWQVVDETIQEIVNEEVIVLKDGSITIV